MYENTPDDSADFTTERLESFQRELRPCFACLRENSVWLNFESESLGYEPVLTLLTNEKNTTHMHRENTYVVDRPGKLEFEIDILSNNFRQNFKHSSLFCFSSLVESDKTSVYSRGNIFQTS